VKLLADFRDAGNGGFRSQRCRTIDGWIEIYMHAFSSVAVVHGWIDGWVDECMHAWTSSRQEGRAE